MGYILKAKTANKKNFGGKRNTSAIKYIIVHFTANDGDSAAGNANFFATNIRQASAHRFADDKYIYVSVPDNCVAWSVGGDKYSDCGTTGGGRLYGVANNTNSLSIELCDAKKNGSIYPTAATITNALAQVEKWMESYGIDRDHVIRHFDVNGKHCPVYWMTDAKWKSEFWGKLPESKAAKAAAVTKGKAPAAAKPTLSSGTSGAQVKILQRDLNYLGADLEVDGKYGNDTKIAVASFQSKHKLTADGAYGRLTYAQMKKALK